MTRSEEESASLALLSQLMQSTEPESILKALQTIKHRLIGHSQNKELFVRLGIVEPLKKILEQPAGPDDAWSSARVEAGILVGSLAYGGEQYITHMIESSILQSLAASLNPATSPPMLVLSTLRTLNTILDTYLQPYKEGDPALNVLQKLYSPEVLEYLRQILEQTSTDTVTQQQICLAATLIAKSVGRQTHSLTDEDCICHKHYQNALVEFGVLDALATKMGSFFANKKGDNNKSERKRLVPSQVPRNASMAPILEAIAAIIQGSSLSCISFMFSPSLQGVFPPQSGTKGRISRPADEKSNATSTYLPSTKWQNGDMQPPQQIVTPAAFPPLPPSSAHFPPLSPRHRHTRSVSRDLASMDASAIILGAMIGSDEPDVIEAPLRRRTDDDEEVQQIGNAKKTQERGNEPKIDVEESELLVWLMSQARTGDSLTRLAAASVVTNLTQAGVVHPRIITVIGLLIIPPLVQMLSKDGRGLNRTPGFNTAGVAGIDAETWIRWQVEENAPAILSRLIMDDETLRKAAVEAGAIKILADLLKRNCRPASDVEMTSNPPLWSHRMRVKDSTMRCLTNLGLFEEEYRHKIIEAEVIHLIVNNCLKSLAPITFEHAPDQSKAEANPTNVLIAACNVIRATARSVAILRTSLIDVNVAPPIFTLLHHPDTDVQIAASATVCNLLLEFSPMKEPIMNLGAIDLLGRLAHHPIYALRLNAVWALRHMILDADLPTKKQTVDALGIDHIWNLLSAPTAVTDSDADETMEDITTPPPPALRHSLPPKATAAVKNIVKKQARDAADLERNRTVLLKSQALLFLRNLVCGTEIPATIDHLFSLLPPDRLLPLLEQIIVDAHNEPGEIVNAAVYFLCHLCAGMEKHKAMVEKREALMRGLVGLWNHREVSVRSGLAWTLINLTWVEEGDVGEQRERVRRRVERLKAMGWTEKLREMRKDKELDVRERVKTVEHQMGLVGR